MEPLFYVIAILGCGDGNRDCVPARLTPARYDTMAQCRAALPQEIARNTDIPYPTIGADCREQGVRMVKAGKPQPRG